jgi:antitoxin HicB
MNKTAAYYMGLPYTIEMWRAEEGGWVVRVKELLGCVSQGETPEEALAMIQDAMQGWLEVSLEMGDAIPEPRLEEDYSGKFVVRVPKSLHRQLVDAADREGVSLNQYINVALAQAVSAPPPPARPAYRLPAAETVAVNDDPAGYRPS